MKKSLFVLAVLALPFSASAFVDIAPEDPDYSIYSHLQDIGVMHPDANGAFRPYQTITRAEALAVALRAGRYSLSEYEGQPTLADVDPNAWYAPYVALGLEKRVISNKNTTFRPDQAITKAEFLALLFRATRVNFGSYFSHTKDLAQDIPQSSWYAPVFAYAKRFQVANLPTDNFYRPYKYLTRKEVALMTYRQMRLTYGTKETRLLAELQGQIQQFLGFIRTKRTKQAEFRLHSIMELNDRLARTRNSADAVALQAISRSMNHLMDSLRAFRNNRNLRGTESLYLASKQAHRAAKRSQEIAPFAQELITLIEETITATVTPASRLGLTE